MNTKNKYAIYDMPTDTGYIKDEEILFLIKFQKKKYLEEIINGLIRFTPSQNYIKQEMLLHDKGQGDMLEGKMLIRGQAKYYNDDFCCIVPNANVKVDIQNVNNMPITCFLLGTKNDCIKYKDNKNYIIKLTNDTIQTIKNDFHNPDSALIIPNPQKYINDMKTTFNAVASSIRYYNYDIQTVQRLNFLSSGDENVRCDKLYYKYRYRHLLCKDISFKNQKEYRFIRTDILIDKAEKYYFPFNYDYRLISTDELFSGYEMRLD